MSPEGSPTTDDRSTVAATLRDAEARLAASGIDAPRIQATALLGHAMGRDRAALLAGARDVVGAGARARFDDLLLRRLRNEPLQYLLGRAGFRDFDVRVGPGVFIPRPETEQLVETVLEVWEPGSGWAIDVGTGSGAIAIALARARPRSRVLAIDRSSAALRSAHGSAVDLGVNERISFLRSDLLGAIAGGQNGVVPTALPIGVVASNPPYARTGDVVQPEVVDYEPSAAWLAGPRGTEVYERLLRQAATVLAPGRPFVLEIGYDQSRTVPRLLRDDGRWLDADVAPDFQGIPRVLVTRRA